MPKKWADYLITHVRYSEDNSHIEKVRARKDTGKLRKSKIYSRKAVISAIEDGIEVMTAPVHPEKPKKLVKGAIVEIMKVDGTKYLRTDGNHKASDNLGKLRTF